jgi:transcriptional regulator with XRE-family HTH domain
LSRLKQLRTIRGLTQEAFAELAGISYKYYQAIETGRKPDLRLSTLERLAKGHGLEVYDLFSPRLPPSLKRRNKLK